LSDWFWPADPSATFSVWDVEEGVYPSDSDVDTVDGFIITGSKSSAYEDKEWIRDLERLVRELHARRKKMVGICFGHQVIARALGGTVAKSDKGWGVGVNVYNVSELPVQGDDEVRGWRVRCFEARRVASRSGHCVAARGANCGV
jgi:GMP synthase-like glutamine amidotransferase